MSTSITRAARSTLLTASEMNGTSTAASPTSSTSHDGPGITRRTVPMPGHLTADEIGRQVLALGEVTAVDENALAAKRLGRGPVVDAAQADERPVVGARAPLDACAAAGHGHRVPRRQRLAHLLHIEAAVEAMGAADEACADLAGGLVNRLRRQARAGRA